MHLSHKLLLIILIIPFISFSQKNKFVDHTEEIAASECKLFHQHSKRSASNSGENIDMVYNRFYWEINPEVVFIKGSVTSYFKALAPQVYEIDLELSNNMIIDSIIFQNQKLEFDYFSDFQFKISLSDTLSAGMLDSLTIYYQGVPRQDIGFGTFTQALHEEVPIIWTLSEPYGAKEWWPGKNDLSDKIDSIDVIVKTPQAYRAASHGLLVSESPVGNYKLCHWKHRYPIVSYLVGVAVTNYVEFTNYALVEGDTMPILNYVYPEDSATAASDGANTKEIITLFDELFGPYPFKAEKYGHAQTSMGGGMEHQTMSFMGGFGHDLRAHELAHSWFGNKITLATWHDIFLNEGFATYANGLSFEHMYDGFYWDIWKSNTKNAVLIEPDGSIYVEDTTDVARVFSARLSYHKGAYLLHMLRWVLGEEAFFTAVQNYVADPMLAYRFATLNDLQTHLETAAGINLTAFFNDWYYGEGNPSYGINVTQLDDNKIQVIINQEQSHPSVNYFEMPVPVTIYGGGNQVNLVCDNSFSGEQFIFDDPGFFMDSAKFDPDQWLLAKLEYLNLGIQNLNPQALQIHPNPAKDHISFFIPNSKILNIQLSDLTGNILLDQNPLTRNEVSNIKLSDFPKGMYLLFVKTDSGNYHGKFIKN